VVSRIRSRSIVLAVAGTIGLVLLAASAPAARTGSTNLSLSIAVGTSIRNAPVIARGGTATVDSLSFKAGVTAETYGPDQATVRVRLELPAGLRWGTDLPDPSENCTSTASVAECLSSYALDYENVQRSGVGWLWDIVADGPGTYVLRAEIVEASMPDPDSSNNSSSVTVVVKQSVSASSVKLLPPKPKAGSAVSAQVRVTTGGRAVTPTAPICAGAIGRVKLAGRAKVVPGSVTCVYKTPHSARGKTLKGTVSFNVSETKLTRRFSATLH
jgi:hypothetical protein